MFEKISATGGPLLPCAGKLGRSVLVDVVERVLFEEHSFEDDPALAHGDPQRRHIQ